MKITKWEVGIAIGSLLLIIAAITTNLHCWGKPYDWSMFSNLTRTDWFLWGFGMGITEVCLWRMDK